MIDIVVSSSVSCSEHNSCIKMLQKDIILIIIGVLSNIKDFRIRNILFRLK